MTNYVKNYRKKDITKAYDLLELKANGRIDGDGDYLDDEGNKLTKTIYKKVSYKEQQRCTEFLEKYEHSNDAHRMAVDGITKLHIVETLENKSDIIHADGFICVGVDGEKWCVSRDIFLATYEEVE
jgi:hypothetical protein